MRDDFFHSDAELLVKSIDNLFRFRVLGDTADNIHGGGFESIILRVFQFSLWLLEQIHFGQLSEISARFYDQCAVNVFNFVVVIMTALRSEISFGSCRWHVALVICSYSIILGYLLIRHQCPQLVRPVWCR